MEKTYSGGLITWNRGLLRRGTSHLNLWSDDARGGNHRLGLWGHRDDEFCREDEKKKKRLITFLKFFKLWTQSSNKEEKSLMMTLEWLLSFYKRSNRSRYAARISRSIVVRRVATRPERGSRVLKRTSSLQALPDTWQRTQNANLVFTRAANLQQGEARVSTLKSASLPRSKNGVSTSKTVSW